MTHKDKAFTCFSDYYKNLSLQEMLRLIHGTILSIQLRNTTVKTTQAEHDWEFQNHLAILSTTVEVPTTVAPAFLNCWYYWSRQSGKRHLYKALFCTFWVVVGGKILVKLSKSEYPKTFSRIILVHLQICTRKIENDLKIMNFLTRLRTNPIFTDVFLAKNSLKR